MSTSIASRPSRRAGGPTCVFDRVTTRMRWFPTCWSGRLSARREEAFTASGRRAARSHAGRVRATRLRTRAVELSNGDRPGFRAPLATIEGIDIRPIREGEERIAYDIHQESFRDSWEHTAEPFDEWRHYLVDSESFDRGLWFVAWDGDRPAGAALCRVRDGVGWIGILGVLRDRRRRGSAVRCSCARSTSSSAALPRAGLGVDAESLTGANRLYESAGMHVVRRLDFFDKQLAPSRA